MPVAGLLCEADWYRRPIVVAPVRAGEADGGLCWPDKRKEDSVERDTEREWSAVSFSRSIPTQTDPHKLAPLLQKSEGETVYLL